MPEDTTTNNVPELTADQQEMLQQIRQIDVDEQRSFAGIQSKLSLGVLATGVVISLFIEDNWHLVLIIAVAISFLFFVVSRAKYGFCELQELIQGMDRKQTKTDQDKTAD
ncbi:MAG: hypothetical protein CMJ46_16370 [Planctomyces sp.]|nr:hypothetical protein [Planctomyces sp.]